MTYDPFKSEQENLVVLDEKIQDLKNLLKSDNYKKKGITFNSDGYPVAINGHVKGFCTNLDGVKNSPRPRPFKIINNKIFI